MAKHMAPTRRSFSSALARVVLLGLVCQGLLLFAVSVARADTGTPTQGDWFEYRLVYGLRDGSGWYSDWWEETVVTGKYEITQVIGDNATVHAKYTWNYRDSYYDEDTDTVERWVNFSLTTRNYTQFQTDMDDYDAKDGRNLDVWFWIPANMVLNQKVPMLDDNFTVKDEEETIWSSGTPKLSMRLEATGSYSHYYDGKTWTGATYTDKYYVDRDSGYVISERYTEQNSGTFHSMYTRWQWYIEYDITASSFEVAFDVPLLSGMIIGITAAIVLPTLGIFAIYRYARWRPRTDSFRSYGQVKIYRVRKIEDFPQHLENHATDQFGAFLVDFATKILLAGGRVAVAVAVGKNELVGVAFYNKEEDAGFILCKNTEVTDVLRRFVNCQDFFSEVRHEIPADMLENMRKFDNPNIPPQAFNTFETYQVLKLAPIQQVDYDTNFISYMKPKDLSAVVKVAKQVYGTTGKKTFQALLDSGDIGFVARVKGQVVGFAFASFVNQMGRNHTLTVIPKFRNQGIGRELARARLATLANLGAEAVITEIADWNLPSLQVSGSLGFKKVGVMFVETARTKKIKKNIVRW